jgi:hypothetical protein
MAHNQLKGIPERLFSHCNRLNRVDFSFNRIAVVPSNFVSFCKKAISIDLAHNLIRTLPQIRELSPADEDYLHTLSSSAQYGGSKTAGVEIAANNEDSLMGGSSNTVKASPGQNVC